MFFSKSKHREPQQISNQPVEEKESSINRFYKEVVSFIETMKKLLKDTVKQHHTVNDQHNDLANLTEEVKDHMRPLNQQELVSMEKALPWLQEK